MPPTPYGAIQLHRHNFRMSELPANHYVFFCVRDPISRYFSGFYSRLNKGQPRYYREWTSSERAAFEAFPTPQRLAAALVSTDEDERRAAKAAMRGVQHLRLQQRNTGTPAEIRAHLGQIVYIGKQETLNSDWPQLKSILHLPQALQLPSDPVRAHRSDPSLDTALEEASVRALQAWYARDYDVLAYCDEIRAHRGWGNGPPEGPGFREVMRQWTAEAVPRRLRPRRPGL
jgi:hypothetical protein